MNKKQKIVLWIGIIAFVWTTLHPHVIIKTYIGYGDNKCIERIDRNCYPLFGLPDTGEKTELAIDFQTLGLQWIIIAVVIGGLLVTFKDKKPSLTRPPKPLNQ